jgi:CheY-like chemotaxis protein
LKPVLIIDDDPRNIFALSAVLKTRNYTVLAANNMVEAIAVLETQKEVGIILLDMMMPGMDGFDAIPLLKSTDGFKHIPLVAVTAKAMPGDKEKCLNAGADDYLSKPVDIDLLLDVIHKRLK